MYAVAKDYLQQMEDQKLKDRMRSLKMHYIEWLDVLELIMERIQRARKEKEQGISKASAKQQPEQQASQQENIAVSQITVDQTEL